MDMSTFVAALFAFKKSTGTVVFGVAILTHSVKFVNPQPLAGELIHCVPSLASTFPLVQGAISLATPTELNAGIVLAVPICPLFSQSRLDNAG